MPVYTDQLGRKVELESVPKRIVSLVPSQTELLFYLGLTDEVVGITKFCIHPGKWFRTKTRVGGTKQLNFNAIQALAPDLIIGNKEENEQQQIEELIILSQTIKGQERGAPVWMSDIITLKDALDMIVKVGTIVGKQQHAVLLKLQIENAFRDLEKFVENNFKQSNTNSLFPKVAYFIWQNPYMVACKNTFIDNMLTKCGLQNAFGEETSRYAEVTAAQLKEVNPDIIFLSSEPYPFKHKHLEQFQAICPKAKVQLVDGELFSWYGSRLLQSPAYFKNLLSEVLNNS